MTNPLTDARQTVIDCLSSSQWSVFSTKPDRFSPPAVFVGPGDPYVSREGASFGNEIVRLQVTIVVASGTNETRAGELDVMLTDVLDALYGLDLFDVTDVQQPGQIAVGGEAHLAVAVGLLTEITR